MERRKEVRMARITRCLLVKDAGDYSGMVSSQVNDSYIDGADFLIVSSPKDEVESEKDLKTAARNSSTGRKVDHPGVTHF